jgi:hypothetical protein
MTEVIALLFAVAGVAWAVDLFRAFAATSGRR